MPMAQMQKPHSYGQSDLNAMDYNHCTFSEIRVWHDLPSQAQQLCDKLNDNASIHLCRLPSESPIECPGAAWQVQWACQAQLDSVNMVAKPNGVSSIIRGAGGQRSFTPSDLLVQQIPAGLWKSQAELVSGVIIVKAPWQFQLRRGDTLYTIFADKSKLNQVKSILQHVSLFAISKCGMLSTIVLTYLSLHE